MNVNLVNIDKQFGHVQANADISLNIPEGKIFGILGENGAGKSTLMKILSGYIQPDAGEIILDGEVVEITTPADAIKFGIGMLHQDPLDFPPMQVIENFILGKEANFILSYRENFREFERLQSLYGFSLDPKGYIDTLTVGERQQLEILRLLWLGARVLILDEPTTGISAQQKEKLFEALRTLAEGGKTVVFVSHKLEDVENLCHNIAILRNGLLVGEAKPPYRTDQLVEMMFGKQITLPEPKSFAQQRVVLDIADLEIEKYPLTIGPVNFKLHAGEVVGLAGMEGSGQNMLLRACVGLLSPISGRIVVNGEDMTRKNYLEYLTRGATYLPASRLEEGLVPGLTLAE
ncbi:MAG: ATP-binding cassette domain-containing protein, partial [Brevefilum sp.]